MLDPSQRLAIYMESSTTSTPGKMGFGILRYSPNPVVCVIDSEQAGRDMAEVARMPRRCRIVASVREAVSLGAEVLVLGIAPPGGLIPDEWMSAIDEAVAGGLSLINGLHDLLAPRYPTLRPGQWIWDIRVEPSGLSVGTAAAAKLSNRRVLMIGTDMAVGKMTAGLEIFREARQRSVDAEFVATGQIGITLTGRGVPLDAIRVDFASGAIEREVLRCASADLVIVEGQGALIHPGSTSTLPLMRGACPTHLILCHRARQMHLKRIPEISIPPLLDYIRLYEDLGSACGAFYRPRTVGIALNTFDLSPNEAADECAKAARETGLPVADPVRHGAGILLDAVLAQGD